MRRLIASVCACWMAVAGAAETKPKDRDSFATVDVTWQTLPMFCLSNVGQIDGPVRGIAVEHHGLGCGQFKENQIDANGWLAEKGIVYIHPHYSPWAWMNRHAVKLTDDLVSAVKEHYRLPDDVSIVSYGGSMGGQGCLIWPCYSRHRVSAVVANCPVTDLVYHYSERPDLPRTMGCAFEYADDLAEEIRRRSPFHQIGRMPDIPYTILHGTKDDRVSKRFHSDRFVAAMRQAGRTVAYEASEGMGHVKLTPHTQKVFDKAILAPFEKTDKDASLRPVKIVSPPPAKYRDPANIHYQTGPSVAVAPNGRIWVAVMTGGNWECNDNYVDLLTSGDGGQTWSEPKLALDIAGPLRTFDPAMWTDPKGRVWLFWCQVYDFWDGRGGLWASVCERPDDENAVWSAPRRLCDGVMKNKPLVLRNGDIWLFVEQWQNDTAETWATLKCLPQLPDWYHPDTPHVGANVYRSTDKGATWSYFSTVPVPADVRTCDEHMAVQLSDNESFRMLLRTKYGMGESRSTDGGRTWTTAVPSPIKNPPARFFYGRLRSGNVLLVKNGPVDSQTDRRNIIAFLSEDDGRTFPCSLELDMREKVSYPDVSEGPDGLIRCVHDFDRAGIGEIVLDQFTEDDIRAGRLVSPKSMLHRIVRRNAGK